MRNKAQPSLMLSKRGATFEASTLKLDTHSAKHHPCPFVARCLQTLDEWQYETQAENTIVLYNIPKSQPQMETTPASRRLSTLSRFNNRKSLRFAVWKSLDRSNNRSRPIEIELQFDRRLAMSNAKSLKGTNTFDKPKLRWRHRLSENVLLDVRFKLTDKV